MVRLLAAWRRIRHFMVKSSVEHSLRIQIPAGTYQPEFERFALAIVNPAGQPTMKTRNYSKGSVMAISPIASRCQPANIGFVFCSPKSSSVLITVEKAGQAVASLMCIAPA